MAPKYIKKACLIVSGLAPIVFASWAYGNDTESAQQATPARTASVRLMPKASSWTLRLPKDDNVMFQGVVSFDGAGAGHGQMLYPGFGGLVGFLAAIVTHGAIVDSAKEAQKTKLQEEADKVLGPYQSVLAAFSHKDLMQAGLEKISMSGTKTLVGFAEKPSADWRVESTPVFMMTQDQSAIILDNLITVYAPDAPAAAYQNVIRVVSHPRDAADLSAFWTANQGKTLKDESVSLFAHSLDIALGEATNGPSKESNSQKTFRYPEGGTEKMERAQLISEHCNRTVVKTLRDSLMSIPARGTTAADKCGTGRQPEVSTGQFFSSTTVNRSYIGAAP